MYQARLWKIEKQKQVARLPGHKTTDQLFRYERGVKAAGLKVALELELILQVPVSELFPEHYQSCRAEIAERLPVVASTDGFAQQSGPRRQAHICTYANLLSLKKPSEDKINTAKKHSIDLIETLGEAIRQRSRSR